MISMICIDNRCKLAMFNEQMKCVRGLEDIRRDD